MGGRLRSASLDLLRSASLDLLKSSSISLLKCVANSSNSASDSVAQHLKVGGGMTSNNLLMQFQADLLGLSLYRPYVRTASYTIFIFTSVLVFFFSFYLPCFFFYSCSLCRIMPCHVSVIFTFCFIFSSWVNYDKRNVLPCLTLPSLLFSSLLSSLLPSTLLPSTLHSSPLSHPPFFSPLPSLSSPLFSSPALHGPTVCRDHSPRCRFRCWTGCRYVRYFHFYYFELTLSTLLIFLLMPSFFFLFPQFSTYSFFLLICFLAFPIMFSNLVFCYWIPINIITSLHKSMHQH